MTSHSADFKFYVYKQAHITVVNGLLMCLFVNILLMPVLDIHKQFKQKETIFTNQSFKNMDYALFIHIPDLFTAKKSVNTWAKYNICSLKSLQLNFLLCKVYVYWTEYSLPKFKSLYNG